jgi:hypothetical protein
MTDTSPFIHHEQKPSPIKWDWKSFRFKNEAMRICQSCNGVIGSDCFNPEECAQISERQNKQIAFEMYDRGKQDGMMAMIENGDMYELEFGNHVKILLRGVNIQILGTIYLNNPTERLIKY